MNCNGIGLWVPFMRFPTKLRVTILVIPDVLSVLSSFCPIGFPHPTVAIEEHGTQSILF